jgi:hypothetical protein
MANEERRGSRMKNLMETNSLKGFSRLRLEGVEGFKAASVKE